MLLVVELDLSLFPIRLVVAAAAATVLAALPAAAQSTDGLRARVDVRQAPWNAVGKLQAVAGSLRETCTAAAVGARTVLSAAHCLFNIRTRRYFPPSSLHFLEALEGQDFAAAALAEAVVTGMGYDPANPNATRSSDWALITLAAPLAHSDRTLPLASRPPAPGAAIMVGGYGQDNPNVLTADTSCHVLGYVSDGLGRSLIRHDCAATHGVSGAPLLMKTGAGWSIVGINVAHTQAGLIGFAVTLEEVLEHL